MSDSFEKIKQALQSGQMVALTQTPDGGIEVSGAFESSRDAYVSFSADSPEGMGLIPPVIFVTYHQLPPPPENL